MRWQDPQFLDSRDRVKNDIRGQLVEATSGRHPLHTTVLGIDPELEGCPLIPILCVKNPSDSGWKFLDHFGVAVTLDIHYYLRCLDAMSAASTIPEHETVVHIYENIQSRYQHEDNEKLIRYWHPQYPITALRQSRDLTRNSDRRLASGIMC